jgi:hypothetical protein
MMLGLAMNGYELAIASLIRDELAQRFDELTYIEIGVAHGATLTALAEVMHGSACRRWRAIGVELPCGYSFSRDDVIRNAQVKHIQLEIIEKIAGPVNPLFGRCTLYLMDSHKFLPKYWREPIHLALIDGCHGKDCVIKDFNHLEPFIVPDGYVMFHDYGEDQIGQGQTHCATLDVRGACLELGLMNGTHPEWEFVDEFVGDKTLAGANMGVFKKHG